MGLNNFPFLKNGDFLGGGLIEVSRYLVYGSHTQRFCKSYRTNVNLDQSSRENYAVVCTEKVYSLRLYSHLNFLL